MNSTPVAPPSLRAKLLVVDDDRLVLATLVHGLAQAGYEVLDADNGDDAILLAREHRPALALLDIRMQGLSGFDVAAYLRQYCRIPFLFLSAFSDEQTASQARALGAVACLTKPLDITALLPVVAEALARPVADETPALLLATGMLMERERVGRAAARERLAAMAATAGRSHEAQAEALLRALDAAH